MASRPSIPTASTPSRDKNNNGTSPATLLSNNGLIPLSESPNNGSGIGSTEDDISLLWLNNPRKSRRRFRFWKPTETRSAWGRSSTAPR